MLLLLPVTATPTDESARVYITPPCIVRMFFVGSCSEHGDFKAANQRGGKPPGVCAADCYRLAIMLLCAHTEHLRALLTAHWFVYPVQQPPGRSLQECDLLLNHSWLLLVCLQTAAVLCCAVVSNALRFDCQHVRFVTAQHVTAAPWAAPQVSLFAAVCM
jgi:hypothetical protein